MRVERPLSLYIHIPFCTLKCSYCDFNSYTGIEGLMRPFVDALCKEMRVWGQVLQGDGFYSREAPVAAAADRIAEPTAEEQVSSEAMGASALRPWRIESVDSDRRRIETVFFGGGTPSLLPLGEVERIITAIQDEFDVAPDAEVSFEANPGTVDGEYLRGLRSHGMNRISFGVQSFDDDELKALDRIHSAEEAREAYRWARETGFERINLDLIYGLPEQPTGGWQATLEQAIALGPEHLSLYALTVEEGTKLAHDIERGRAPAPDGDVQAAMYEWSCERLAQAGYRQYEISNWCLPGEACRHNLVYWRNGEWLGLGPGAQSHLRSQELGVRSQGWRFADVYSPRRYIEAVAETAEARRGSQSSGVRSHGTREMIAGMRQVAFVEEQTAEMDMADTAILGLRLNEGLDTAAFERRFGCALDEVYGTVLAEAASLGLVEGASGRVRLTERGRLLANEVFVRLLP